MSNMMGGRKEELGEVRVPGTWTGGGGDALDDGQTGKRKKRNYGVGV